MRPVGDAALNADGGLRVEQDDAVLTITLATPDRRNAQLPATWRALAALATDISPDVRVVVLAADGPSFSAGLDRRMFTGGVPGETSILELAAGTDHQFDTAIKEFQQGFTRWRELDAIVVSAVQGHAVGAGFQLALAADFMLVADDVSLSMKETQLGLVPDLGGTEPLVEAVGYSRALEICATGRRVGAHEAVASGIAVAQVPAATLPEATAAKVAELLSAPGGALIETKRLLRGASKRSALDQFAFERAMQRIRAQELAEMFSNAESD
jgi:enoyl-CoA hydratase/carnithine racemase